MPTSTSTHLPPLPWWDVRSPPELSRNDAVRLTAGVPPGWVPLMSEILEGLVGVRTVERQFSLMFMTVEFEDGHLRLDMPFADHVLSGIARRCSSRSRFLCQQCGRGGRLRQFGMSEAAVLCPKCAAPEYLYRAIKDIDKFSGLIVRSGEVDGDAYLPRILRRSFARAAAREGTAQGRKPSLDRAAFKSWIADLKRLQSVVPRAEILLHLTA